MILPPPDKPSVDRFSAEPTRGLVVAPIVLFLLVSTLAAPLLSMLQDASRLDPNLLRLTVFSTVIGASAVVLIWRSALRFPPPARSGLTTPMVLAVIVSVAFAGLLLGLAKMERAPWRPASLSGLGAPIGIFTAIQLLGAVTEEVGWRGLVQPLLETRVRPAIAALITGALFAIGHFYVAFAVPPWSFALFFIGAVGVSLVLGAFTVGRAPWRRILLASVLHFLINMVTFGLFNDGDSSPLYFGDLALVFGLGGVIAFLALLRQAQPARSTTALAGVPPVQPSA